MNSFVCLFRNLGTTELPCRVWVCLLLVTGWRKRVSTGSTGHRGIAFYSKFCALCPSAKTSFSQDCLSGGRGMSMIWKCKCQLSQCPLTVAWEVRRWPHFPFLHFSVSELIACSILSGKQNTVMSVKLSQCFWEHCPWSWLNGCFWFWPNADNFG